MMKQRKSTPGERERVEQVLDPGWAERTASDCRPGIRGFCGLRDCPKCTRARQRAAERADDEGTEG